MSSFLFFFSSRRRHTRFDCDWSSDVCSSDLYQLDRRMAALRGLGRSNGCAFSDGPGHMPLQRMANVSLQPAAGGPSTEDLIAGVENGIYILGDKSWSIDMQRYNFQFTGPRLFRIRNGRLD